MTTPELLARMAATLAADGTRSAAGAVAAAREILDELRRQEPAMYAAAERQQWRDAWHRADERRRTS